jgi:hypothetical protein
MKLGDKNISKILLGDKEVNKVYLGDKLVYEKDEGGTPGWYPQTCDCFGDGSCVDWFRLEDNLNSECGNGVLVDTNGVLEYNAGKSGRCGYLVQESSKGLRVNPSSSLDNLSQWSTSFFMKLETYSDNPLGKAYFFYDGGAQNSLDFYIEHTPEHSIIVNGLDYGGSSEMGAQSFSIPTGFFHCALVVDNGVMKAYVNGSLIYQYTLTGDGYKAAFEYGDPIHQYYGWYQWVDELRIFKKALTTTDINNLKGEFG